MKSRQELSHAVILSLTVLILVSIVIVVGNLVLGHYEVIESGIKFVLALLAALVAAIIYEVYWG